MRTAQLTIGWRYVVHVSANKVQPFFQQGRIFVGKTMPRNASYALNSWLSRCILASTPASNTRFAHDCVSARNQAVCISIQNTLNQQGWPSAAMPRSRWCYYNQMQHIVVWRAYRYFGNLPATRDPILCQCWASVADDDRGVARVMNMCTHNARGRPTDLQSFSERQWLIIRDSS